MRAIIIAAIVVALNIGIAVADGFSYRVIMARAIEQDIKTYCFDHGIEMTGLDIANIIELVAMPRNIDDDVVSYKLVVE